jgi:hypothetical protein
MSLHPQVLRDLLECEADVARERLGDRVSAITVGEAYVEVRFTHSGVERRLRLTGKDYDRRPLSVSFVDPDGTPLAQEQWPPISMGTPHPVLGSPWVCLRGTLEYHLYPGHTAGGDSWDASRGDLRVPDVIDHILQRCGA